MQDSTITSKTDMSMLSSLARDYNRLRRSLQPFSERYHGYLQQRSCNPPKSPFVLLLGNSSSGKSNFVNHVLNRPIQANDFSSTECFTVIKPGVEDIDGNGLSALKDPDLGFDEVQSYGPALVDQTILKIRKNVSVKDVVFVDGPNLMDGDCNVPTLQSDRRSYIEEACRWYAERADVVLLFVDPSKSGAQGETLDTLKSALAGLGDKVLIILNKVDPFQSFQDFIRSYGTLCWNLSRTVPMKDLPKIHTICPPINDEWNDVNASVVSEFTTDEGRHSMPLSSFCDQSHISLHESREEVVREVVSAPRRRVTNDIAQLSEDVTSLQAHCSIMDHLSSQYQSQLSRSRVWVGATAFTSAAAAVYAAPLLFEAARDTVFMSPFINGLKSCARELNSIVRELTTSEAVREVVRHWTMWAVSKPKETFMAATAVCGALATLSAQVVSSIWLNRAAEALASRDSYEKALSSVCPQVMSEAVREQMAERAGSIVTSDSIRRHTIQRSEKEDLQRVSAEVEQLRNSVQGLSVEVPAPSRSRPSSFDSEYRSRSPIAPSNKPAVFDGEVQRMEECVDDDTVSYLSMSSSFDLTTTAQDTFTEPNEIVSESSALPSDDFAWDNFYLDMGLPAPLVL